MLQLPEFGHAQLPISEGELLLHSIVCANVLLWRPI